MSGSSRAMGDRAIFTGDVGAMLKAVVRVVRIEQYYERDSHYRFERPKPLLPYAARCLKKSYRARFTRIFATCRVAVCCQRSLGYRRVCCTPASTTTGCELLIPQCSGVQSPLCAAP